MRSNTLLEAEATIKELVKERDAYRDALMLLLRRDERAYERIEEMVSKYMVHPTRTEGHLTRAANKKRHAREHLPGKAS